MNRTIKDATVKRYHYESHDELRQHLQLFVDAYNYGRRLKTLRGLTPYEFICQAWTREPERFRFDPSHHRPGPNTREVVRRICTVRLSGHSGAYCTDAGRVGPGMLRQTLVTKTGFPL